ncbi:hypothetical protein GCM10027072_50240 [Streptomyces bullii]
MLTGLVATGAVITSAGLVLAGTFAALGTPPGPNVWWPHRLAREDGGTTAPSRPGAGVSRSGG